MQRPKATNVPKRRKKRTAHDQLALHKRYSRRTPLEVMAQVMDGGPEAAKISERQFEAAKSAAPYVHHRLASVQMREQPPPQVVIDVGNLTNKELDQLAELLNRAIVRIDNQDTSTGPRVAAGYVAGATSDAFRTIEGEAEEEG